MCSIFKKIIVNLFLFCILSSTHHVISAEANKSEVLETPSTTPTPSANDDHGFMFPLEDLVDPPKNNDRFYAEFLNMLATLGLVIAVILIAAWLIRRLLNTRLEQINTTSIIKIIERRALSPKSAIYLLEIYDKVIAIAETQNGVTQLGEFKPTEDAEETAEIPTSFKKILESK